MFYKVNSTRFTLREYYWSNPVWSLPILALLKFLRVRLPMPGAVPDAIEPFLVKPEEIPEDVKAKIQPLEAQMRDCGFVDPVWYWLCDPFASRRICTVTLRHESGAALGHITFIQLNARRPPKEVLVPAFSTAFDDGSRFQSTAGRPEFLAPPECKVQRVIGASVSELWELHNKQIGLESFGKRIVSAHSREEMLTAWSALAATHCSFQIRRGVLVPRSEAEQQAMEAVMATPGDQREREFAAVYAEIERLANRKASWTSSVLIMLVTLALFFAGGSSGIGWGPFGCVVGVLFFHELGHLAAMSLFRYRNLRMFFIPFLGAIITGQNYNVPGWKKALVSLAGPVPGIVVGAVLFLAMAFGVIALEHSPAVMFAAFVLLALNGFNLLPIMPLDGGQLMHAVVFSRHPALDVAFQGITAGLLALSGFLKMIPLAILGVLMLLGLRMTRRVAAVVSRLRKRGVDAASPDARTIPLETARLIEGELRQVLPARPTATIAARLTLNCFELLNARPPGWAASLALLGVYGLSLLTAVGLLLAPSLPQFWSWRREAIAARTQGPKHAMEPREILTWKGAAAPELDRAAVDTVIADFTTRQDAEKCYQDNTAKLPSRAAATLFGQTFMLVLPAENDEARKRWFDTLEACCRGVAVQCATSNVPFALACAAPDAEVAERLTRAASSYFRLPSAMYAVAPWSSEQRLSDGVYKARLTYLAICEHGAAYGSDPRWRSLNEKMRDLRRRGDVQAVKQLSSEFKRLSRDIEKEHIQRMRSEGEDKWDISFLDFYEKPVVLLQGGTVDSDAGVGREAKPAGDVFTALFPALAQGRGKPWILLGPLLGQLPMDGNAPTPAAMRFSTTYGTVVRSGRTIRFEMFFQQPSAGAPALVNWLSQSGCAEFRYEFHVSEDATGDWDDE